MEEIKFTAPDGCVLVRTSPPEDEKNGVKIPVWVVDAQRPDRGEIVSMTNVEGVSLGDILVYDHTEATKVSENLWSVPDHAFFFVSENGKIKL